MGKFEVGLISGLTILLICILVVGYAPFSPFSPFEGVWRAEIDIREEIGKLRTHYDGNYSTHEDDWVEWSRLMEDAGGDFTKIGTWEEFKASLESSDITVLMLDEQNRVVWFNPPLSNKIVYLEY